MRPLALFNLARVSNLPTVCTNVLVGYALVDPRPDVDPSRVAIAMFAGMLLYAGGMVTNDALDASSDATDKPSRPIPKGQVSMRRAVALAVALHGSAFVSAAVLSTSALGIALLIAACSLAYNLTHRSWSVSILALVLCRALLFPLGALAAHELFPGPIVLVPACITGLWVLGLSIVARGEDRPDKPRLARFVPILIAGLCVLDAIYLVSVGALAFAGIALVCFPLTLALQRCIPGS